MIIILLILITLLVLMVISATKILHHFYFIKKIKNKWISWLVACIPILFILLLFNTVNFAVIIMHFILFTGIAKLIMLVIKKIHPKDFAFYLEGSLAIILTTVYLLIGFYLDYHVFETTYNINTEKEIGQDFFRIIQISDSHIGTTFDGNGFEEHLKKISTINADIIAITGDFVDDDTKKIDMIKSCQALSLLRPKYGIYFIYGNHDEGYSQTRDFTSDDLEKELIKNNVIVLKDDVKKINENIYIVGRKDKSQKRKAIKELVNDIPEDKYIIDLNHQPNDYDEEKKYVDLVLSGHTHGGQLFPLGIIGTTIGANDKTYGIEKRNNTYFIVNSGISNWALSFKTGTKSEYGIINILTKKM